MASAGSQVWELRPRTSGLVAVDPGLQSDWTSQGQSEALRVSSLHSYKVLMEVLLASWDVFLSRSLFAFGYMF